MAGMAGMAPTDDDSLLRPPCIYVSIMETVSDTETFTFSIIVSNLDPRRLTAMEAILNTPAASTSAGVPEFLSFTRTSPPPRRPSRLDATGTAALLGQPDLMIYGKPVQPRLDLTVADLLDADLFSLKGIRRPRQPEPMQPNGAVITTSRQRVAVAPGALSFLGGESAVVLVGSLGLDLIFVALPQPTTLRTVGIESRVSRAYMRLQAFGEMTAGVIPGEYTIQYGFFGPGLPALRIPDALTAPVASDCLLNGLIWLPSGTGPQVASTAAATAWRAAHSWEIRTRCGDAAAYVGGIEEEVAAMETPWRPRRCNFHMAEVRPSGIGLHPDVDAEMGHPPGLALCAERDWLTTDGPSDLVLVASAVPALAYSMDRTSRKAPRPLIRLDGRLGWLRHCLRFGPWNGDIACDAGILSLRLCHALRPFLMLQEPHRVAFPVGASSHAPKSVRFANGTRDPFFVPGEEIKA